MHLGYWSPLPEDELIGSKKALILGPSLGTTFRAWQAALSFAGDDIKPLVFDLPGHGLTHQQEQDWSIDDLAQAVIRLADDLEIRQFTYAGSSISGLVGYQLALEYGNRVSSVGIFNSAPKLGSEGYWLDLASQTNLKGTKSLTDLVVPNWFSDKFFTTKPEIVSQFSQELASVDDVSFAQGCRAIVTFDVWNQLADIEVPTLIVHGAEDKMVSWADAQRADSLVADSGLIEISGVSHQAAIEAPEVAIKHISFYARKFR